MSINYYPPNGFDGSNSVQSLPFYLAVQQGKVPGYSMVNKFGYNPSIGSTAFETIWLTWYIYFYYLLNSYLLSIVVSI